MQTKAQSFHAFLEAFMHLRLPLVCTYASSYFFCMHLCIFFFLFYAVRHLLLFPLICTYASSSCMHSCIFFFLLYVLMHLPLICTYTSSSSSCMHLCIFFFLLYALMHIPHLLLLIFWFVDTLECKVMTNLLSCGP